MRLLLASRSAARRQMLEAAGVKFEGVDAEVDEEAAKARLKRDSLSGAQLAEALAEMKALSVRSDPEALVLGSDQTLEREDGSLLDKPGSRAEAFEQLRSLSGKTHRLHSAAVVTDQGRTAWRHTESVALKMRPLSDAFVEAYLKQEYEVIRHSVGGYRIEGPGVQLFEKIEGSHFAILGLPLLPLLCFLRERGVIKS